MTNETDECHQFGIIRTALRQDLVSWHGFPNSEAGKILNWFNPADEKYLEHVDEWVKLLCAGAVDHCPAPFNFIHHNAFGSYDLFEASIDEVRATHQVAKILFKYHGIPRRKTDMEEVKHRLSQPLLMALDKFELQGIRECLSDIRPCDLNYAVGRFGPGATAEGFTSYEKWSRLGAIPDVPPNLYRANPRDPWIPHFIEMQPTTKIAEVPKSIKSNRIVSSEPAMFMFAQLAVNDHLVREIHRVFRGHVSLDDQIQHNQLLYDHDACTLDLKDASDHVSVELVQAVLPQLWPVLAKVRSTFARFPDGEEIPLRTFAPMGSGLCFSVMTTVILGIIRYAAKIVRREFPGRRVLYSVYGDDAIVSLAMYDVITDLFSRAGLLVNTDKSCCNLLFKESCGLELFRGENITPAYIRDPIDSLGADKVEQVASALQERAFPNTARVVAEVSNAIRSSRWHEDLQRLEVCVRVPSAQAKLRSLDGWSGLNRWFSVRTQGFTALERRPTGATVEVWTKQSWRYKPSDDYPYLTHWFVTR